MKSARDLLNGYEQSKIYKAISLFEKWLGFYLLTVTTNTSSGSEYLKYFAPLPQRVQVHRLTKAESKCDFFPQRSRPNECKSAKGFAVAILRLNIRDSASHIHWSADSKSVFSGARVVEGMRPLAKISPKTKTISRPRVGSINHHPQHGSALMF